MKKFILLGLVLLTLLTAGAMPQMLWADEEKVSRLTVEEATYVNSLLKAYSAAFGYVNEMQSLVAAWGISPPAKAEVVTDLMSYQQKFSSLSATFRQKPPKALSDLASVNNAIADKLDSCLSPCLAIVGEEAVQRGADWAKSFIGITPTKKDGPSAKVRMVTSVTGQIAALKGALEAGQAAFYTRVAEIEQERFEKEMGAEVIEKWLFDDCFIATAAYGTPATEEIDILRQFRDDFLLQHPAGKAFVALYYELSPPIAEFISEHEVVRAVVREGFVDPAVAVVESTQGWWAE